MAEGGSSEGREQGLLSTIAHLSTIGEVSLESTEIFASLIRGLSVEMSSLKGTSHLGSVLSCADMLAVSSSLAKDAPQGSVEIVLSKGHAALGLYASLFLDQKIGEQLLFSFSDEGSLLEEHPNHLIPGVEFPTGSLGHGLALMAGRILGARLQQQSQQGIVVLSDGECNEGTVWEAVLFSAAKRLGGLVALVDSNGFQATGPTTETYGQIRLVEMFRGFGWEGEEIDGHDHGELKRSIRKGLQSSRPYFVIARTIKGKGVSWMEADNNWHYRVPSQAEVIAALRELGIPVRK